MPKFAATLASLLLIASSIGVNIARYPNVGRSIEPGQLRAAEPANSAQTNSQLPPGEAANADVPSAKPEDAAASSESPQTLPAARDAFARPGIPTSDSAATERPNAAVPIVSVPIIDVQAITPVAGVQADSGNTQVEHREFQRLPPIETDGFAALEPETGLDSPNYPTTATP